MGEEYSTFRWYDYLIFAGTLAVSLGIGVYYACTGGKQRTTQEYLLAGRSMSALPVALSLFASYTSAIMILGATAEFYEHGITQFFVCIGVASAYLISGFLLIPQFYGMGYTSSYTFLERRYNSRLIRLAGSLFYILHSFIYMGLAMYSPAIALEGVTGIPLVTSLLVTGTVVVMYSTIGGLKAVIGTDTFQGILMIGGCLLVLILGIIKIGGIGETWKRASEAGRLDINYTFSPMVRASVPGAVLGSVSALWIAQGTNQSTVQRVIATGGVQQAKRVMFLMVPISLLNYTIVYACGMVVFSYYDKVGCDPLKTGQISSPNQLLPFFIMDVIRLPGMPGLFMAVVFCGALSTVSSCLNGMCAVTWKDFMEGKFNTLSEIKKTTINKLLVFIYGIAGVACAFAFKYAKGNILQLTSTLVGAINGPIDGVFLMGLFFPWSEWIGASIGMVISFVFSAVISIGKNLTFPYVSSLPTNTTMCAALGFNITNTKDAQDKEVFPLFMITFNWYQMIAVYLCATIGLFISTLFLARKTQGIREARLLVPVFDLLCCCLPAKWRHVFRCGIPYDDVKKDELGRYNMQGLEEFKQDSRIHQTEVCDKLVEELDCLTTAKLK